MLFQFFAITSNAAMNSYVEIFVWAYVFISFRWNFTPLSEITLIWQSFV